LGKKKKQRAKQREAKGRNRKEGDARVF